MPFFPEFPRSGGRSSIHPSARRRVSGKDLCSAGSSRGTTIPGGRIRARPRSAPTSSEVLCRILFLCTRAARTGPRDRSQPVRGKLRSCGRTAQIRLLCCLRRRTGPPPSSSQRSIRAAAPQSLLPRPTSSHTRQPLYNSVFF